MLAIRVTYAMRKDVEGQSFLYKYASLSDGTDALIEYSVPDEITQRVIELEGDETHHTAIRNAWEPYGARIEFIDPTHLFCSHPENERH